MKTAIVNEAVRGQSVAVALKSGAYTVAGTGLCGLGSVLDTAADIGQKVIDATRAAGEACTKKGEEFLAEAAALKDEQPAKKAEEKKAEKKAAPQAQKAAAQAAAPAAKATANKAWSLADFVAQHNEFAQAATAICKEYTKIVFRAEGSKKGVKTAFDAVRRSDGVQCSIFADMTEKTFSVFAPETKEDAPKKAAATKVETKKAKSTAKKANKEEKSSNKAAAPVKETVKAEPAKAEEAKEAADMKAALKAASAKKAAAKAKTVKVETKAEAAPIKEEKSSKKAPAKEAVKKAEEKKEPYSSNSKADMALEEAVHDHGEWLDKVIRHFQTVSTKALTNVVVKSNYIKFSSYGENGQDNAVSVAFKSHTVKVNRKVVKLDL